MSSFDLKEQPHSRLNLLTGERVLVSPQRTKRPWQGKTETVTPRVHIPYDPACYLCPGNTRADGAVNPVYTGTFAFTNDFAALVPGGNNETLSIGNMLSARQESGTCRVISFSPDHSLTLPQLSEAAIKNVIDTWASEFTSLAANPDIRYVQIFENKGEIMGCSNPHPHSQIWAIGSLPPEIIREHTQQQQYFESHGSSLLADYLKLELELNERIVSANDHFVALVPFWAVWPYETMIISRRQVAYITDFTDEERTALAQILKRLTARYDNLFGVSFPYSAGIHGAPVNDGAHPEWHWHYHFYPPLLRSATVKKFMVGFELLAGPQRDITPEWAAERLRAQSDLLLPA